MDSNQTVSLENTFRYIHDAGCYGFVEPDKSNTYQKAIKYVSMPGYVIVFTCYFCLAMYTLIIDSNANDFLTFLDRINYLIPISLFFIKFCFLVYNVQNVRSLFKIIQYDYLLCSQLDLENSFELYKKYASRINMLSTIWDLCVKLNVVAWVIKPIIFLLYDKFTTNTNNFYPRIFYIVYPFDINDLIYSLIFMYETFTIIYFCVFVVFQDVMIILFITIMCYHFDVIRTVLSSIKYKRHSEIDNVNESDCSKLLHKKVIICIKSHQELLK